MSDRSAIRVVFLRQNLPDSLSYQTEDPEACLGRALVVPLRGRLTVGLGVRVHEPDPELELAPVQQILSTPPALSEELLQLGNWLGTYYLSGFSSVFQRILPPAYLPRITERWLRAGNSSDRSILSDLPAEEGIKFGSLAEKRSETLSELRDKLEEARRQGLAEQSVQIGRPDVSRRTYQYVVLTDDSPENPDDLSPREQDLLDHLRDRGDTFRTDLPESLKRTDLLNRAEEKGFVRREERSRSRVPLARRHGEQADPEFTLTDEQQRVLDAVEDDVREQRFGVHLLHGITGSGKTEVYFRAARQVLDEGEAVLVLVPEITLASFQSRRFVERFGDTVALWHSEMSRGERRDEWDRIQSGEARLILGVQSAVFAPALDLGLLIVDEEHDTSYKAGQDPRYHARDVAVKRAQFLDCPVLLGSATPSVESYANVHRGRYRGHSMNRRPTGGEPAGVLVQDLRNEQHMLTDRLIEKTERSLSEGARAIWFLNRRGSAQFLLCQECGDVPECPDCSVSLTLHQGPGRLRCHYCGYSRPVPSTCDECGSEEIARVGSGTEKLASVATRRFPDARVFRLDADTVGRKGAREECLEAFGSTPGSLLVGTQMVTKGLDFEDLMFVGIVNADVSLHFPDFRSGERTFQQLVQVIGRAGRDRPDAEVLLQTYNPEHYAVQRALDQDFEGFFRQELNQRRPLKYPPYSRLIDLRCRGNREEDVVRTLRNICDILPDYDSIDVLGPSPCGIDYVKGKHRWHLLCRGWFDSDWKERTRERLPRDSSVRVTVDVDPVDLM